MPIRRIAAGVAPVEIEDYERPWVGGIARAASTLMNLWPQLAALEQQRDANRITVENNLWDRGMREAQADRDERRLALEERRVREQEIGGAARRDASTTPTKTAPTKGAEFQASTVNWLEERAKNEAVQKGFVQPGTKDMPEVVTSPEAAKALRERVFREAAIDPQTGKRTGTETDYARFIKPSMTADDLMAAKSALTTDAYQKLLGAIQLIGSKTAQQPASADQTKTPPRTIPSKPEDRSWLESLSLRPSGAPGVNTLGDLVGLRWFGSGKSADEIATQEEADAVARNVREGRASQRYRDAEKYLKEVDASAINKAQIDLLPILPEGDATAMKVALSSQDPLIKAEAIRRLLKAHADVAR